MIAFTLNDPKLLHAYMLMGMCMSISVSPFTERSIRLLSIFEPLVGLFLFLYNLLVIICSKKGR